MKKWVLIGWVALASCGEVVEKPVRPGLVLMGIEPTTAVAHTDSVRIRLQYEDAQGDIGEMDPDSPSLSVRDARLPVPDWVHIPPVTPDLMELHVTGELTVVLPPPFLLGNGSFETTTFTLQLMDRAGNVSDPIVTPEILIVDTL